MGESKVPKSSDFYRLSNAPVSPATPAATTPQANAKREAELDFSWLSTDQLDKQLEKMKDGKYQNSDERRLLSIALAQCVQQSKEAGACLREIFESLDTPLALAVIFQAGMCIGILMNEERRSRT